MREEKFELGVPADFFDVPEKDDFGPEGLHSCICKDGVACTADVRMRIDAVTQPSVMKQLSDALTKLLSKFVEIGIKTNNSGKTFVMDEEIDFSALKARGTMLSQWKVKVNLLIDVRRGSRIAVQLWPSDVYAGEYTFVQQFGDYERVAWLEKGENCAIELEDFFREVFSKVVINNPMLVPTCVAKPVVAGMMFPILPKDILPKN